MPNNFLFKWFKEEVGKDAIDEYFIRVLLTLIAPLSEAHGFLVKDLEQRLQNWDGSGGPKAKAGQIADVLLTHLPPLIPVKFPRNYIYKSKYY